MALRKRFLNCLVGVFVCVIFIFHTGSVFALDQLSTKSMARYRVETLRNISTGQGIKYLQQLGINDVSELPGPGMILISAAPLDLVRASVVLSFVDTEQQFVIAPLPVASQLQDLPNYEEIESEVENASIGTFDSLPPIGKPIRAILDVFGSDVFLIAPAEHSQEILSAIERLQASKDKLEESVVMSVQVDEPNETAADSEPNKIQPKTEVFSLFETSSQTDTNASPSDELFSKLVSSLAEAEQETPTHVEPKSADVEKVLEKSQFSDEASTDLRQFQETPPVQEKVEKSPLEDVHTEELSTEAAISEEPVEEEEFVAEMEETSEDTLSVRSYEPEPIETGKEMLDLDLPEKLQIVDLLGLIGEYLNLDYMYDPGEVKGDVTLRLRGPIKVKDLYPLLESVLKFRGFTMSRRGNLVTIVGSKRALEIDPVLLHEDGGKIEVGDVVVTRVFELEHVNPKSAQNLLTKMKLGLNIEPVEETGTVIVTGYTNRMPRIEELLRMVDKPGEPKEFRHRQLKYTMAGTMKDKIKTLSDQLGTISISIAAPAPKAAPKAAPKRGRGKTRKTPTPAPKAEAAVSVFLDTDERTNRILMIGTPEQLGVVESLIDTLDVAQQDLRTFRLYEIQHVGAEEIKTKLTDLGIIGGKSGAAPKARSKKSAKEKITAPVLAAGATGPAALTEEPQIIIVEATNSLLANATAEQHAQIAMIIGYVDSETLEQAIDYKIYPLESQEPEDLAGVLTQLVEETVMDQKGKVESVVKKTDEDIIIVPDENTFSIIVYASKKNQRWIGNLIEQLDKRRPQVLIDVTLVEITQSDTFSYDLSFVSKLPALASGGSMDKLGALLTPFPASTVTELTSSAGTGQGFYADRHIQTLLKLMAEKKYGRVLAQPKLLVNDNESGTINTVFTSYVTRTTSTQLASGDGLTGDSLVGSSISFDPYDSGITLGITPHISEGNLLRLEITMDRSDQDPISTNGAPGDKTSNNISTVVTVPDRSTIILGGMQQMNQNKGAKKIPLLGDIPVVGGLFRSIDDSNTTSKLYIFVKAFILRPDIEGGDLPDLVRESDNYRAAFEKAERKFQEYKEWPGGEAKPLEPLRVLEVK